jgi:hypothetical protein
MHFAAIDYVRWCAFLDLPIAAKRHLRARSAAFLPFSIAIFAFCALAPVANAANFTCSWNDATANWTLAADWSNCNGNFPNNSSGNTYDVTISQGNPTLTTPPPGITVGSATITSPGVWSITGTGTATLTGGLGNAGVLNVDIGNGDGGGNLTITGTLGNTNTVQVGSGNPNFPAGAANTLTLGALTNGSGASFAVIGSASHLATLAFTGAGFTTNDGSFGLTNITPLTLNNSFTNNATGTFALGGIAPVTVAGNFANAGVLNVDIGNGDGGGNLTITGTLGNTKTVQVGSSNPNFPAGAANTLTLGALSNASTGTIDLFGNAGNPTNEAKATVNGQATNAGTINIPTNSSLTVSGAGNAYTQTAGSTNLRGGALSAPDVNITGGTLQGMGTVTGAIHISGSGTIEAINLANSNLAAVLTIDGNYFQSGGTFSELLHGTGVQIDKVAVTAGHTVNLTGGNLQLSGVTFALGQEFDDIMTFQPGGLSGTFATIQGGGNGTTVDLGNGLSLMAIYDNADGDISVKVVPTVIGTGKIWIDATGNWTTDTAKWSPTGAPVATDDVTIGSTNNGNVTLDNSTTIHSLIINTSNALTNTSGTTLTVSTTVANSGSLTLGGNLTASGAVTNNSGATLAMRGGTLTAPSYSNAGTTSGFGTIIPLIANTGLVQANGGTLTAQNGIQGTGNITVSPAATLDLSKATAGSTASTLNVNGALNLGSQNLTVASDYNNANFGTGNSFNKLANVSGTGQILAAGPNPAKMEVITGAKVTGGNTATPTLNLGIVHTGDPTAYQIANQGTAANPSLRGATQTNVNGGNITGSLLTGTGVTAANFGPIAPGTSTTDFTVTAASPGILINQAVHITNNFGNVPEQTMSITGQVNNFAALSLLKEGGDGSLSDSFVLDFGSVAAGSGTEEAMLAILNDNLLAEQAFTDLLSSTATVVSGSGFRFTGCSVKNLLGGVSQGGCDIFFDTDLTGVFTEVLDFPVESSNSSGYDQVIRHVTLTIEGSVGSGPPPSVPEPSTMTILGSGLGTLFFIALRRRRRCAKLLGA